MTISVIGLNHKSATIEVREKFSFTADNISLLLRRIKKMNKYRRLLLCLPVTEQKFMLKVTLAS